jgi:hypothetical protein
VEPETGILRQSAHRRSWRSIVREKDAAKPLDFVSIKDGMEYRKFDGIWYFHEFVEVEVKTPSFLRGSFYRWNIDKQAVSKMKRQLGKKQLKQLGLQNG